MQPVAVPSFFQRFGGSVAERNLADPARHDANQRQARPGALHP
jgi:hypothetical protein